MHPREGGCILRATMVVGFGITDYFFDTDDYTSPLKVNFRNDIGFTPASGLTKQINVKIRSNIVTDQPSPYPFSDSQSYEFYSINEITNDIVLSQNGQIWRQDYISLVNPSLSCLRFEPENIQWCKGGREPREHKNPLYILPPPILG